MSSLLPCEAPEVTVDVAVIGGGPAGLAAALGARRAGASRVVILERHAEPGGILPQCIHNGFGLHVFKEELTGPEYAARFAAEAVAAGVEFWSDTMVLSLSAERELVVLGPRGLTRLSPRAIVLAMGCRERTGPNILLGGARPAGVFTAGTAQRLVNIEGYLPGREVVIVGSGDIGLIMARRLTLEGCLVKAVVELLPFPGGLARNLRQCLDDFGIPLYLGHATLAVEGRNRVTGVVIAPLGPDGRPVRSRTQRILCDTVLLSVGLIPENELSRQAGVVLDPRTGGPQVDEHFETTVPGVFACGNVLQVHDLVDHVTSEGLAAGREAAALGRPQMGGAGVALVPAGLARYVLPQRLSPQSLAAVLGHPGDETPALTLSARVSRPAGPSVVRLGDQPVARLAVARPSEMVRVTAKAELVAAALAGRGGDEPLTFTVEEVSA